MASQATCFSRTPAPCVYRERDAPLARFLLRKGKSTCECRLGIE